MFWKFSRGKGFALLLLFVLWCLPVSGRADFSRDSMTTVELMSSRQYEKVINFVDSTIALCTELERTHHPSILFMREQSAYAYDRLRLEEKALEITKSVTEDAKAAGDYRTVVEAMLTTALIYEKNGLGENCGETLNQVGRLLGHHHLPASLARFYVRKGSYHRFYGDSDSLSIYAVLAIEQGKKADKANFVADGAFLYTIANADNKEVVYERFEEVREYLAEQGDTEKFQDVNTMLVQFMKHFGDEAEARKLNLEIIAEVEAKQEEVNDDPAMLMSVYRDEAEAKFAEGDYKSAYTFLDRSVAYESQFMQSQAEQGVREVEAKYNFEVKDAQLREQESELMKQKAQKTRLIRGLLVVLGLMGMLFYLAIHLRRARQSVARQAEALSIANEELEDSLDEQIVLRAELHHRVKNNLQVIISLLDLQEDRELDPETKSTLRSTSERVYSIAAVHELLYPKKGLDHIRFRSYMEKLCEHSAQLWPAEQSPSFILHVKAFTFNLDTLVPLGVVISELLTNTRKNYNANEESAPEISIRLDQEGEVLTLRYRDNGPGFAEQRMKERPGGLGSYLIKSMARQLRGDVLTFNEHGAVTEIRFREKTQPERVRKTTRNKRKAIQNIS